MIRLPVTFSPKSLIAGERLPSFLFLFFRKRQPPQSIIVPSLALTALVAVRQRTAGAAANQGTATAGVTSRWAPMTSVPS